MIMIYARRTLTRTVCFRREKLWPSVSGIRNIKMGLEVSREIRVMLISTKRIKLALYSSKA